MTEEEMKKLKQTVDYFGHWYNLIGEERVAILEKAVNELEATLELQKENAELKAQIENDRDLPAIAYMQGAEKQKEKDKKQLTKAKDILKWWVNHCGYYDLYYTKKTEQFLSEAEKC